MHALTAQDQASRYGIVRVGDDDGHGGEAGGALLTGVVGDVDDQ